MEIEEEDDEKQNEPIVGEVDRLKKRLEGHSLRYDRTRKRLSRASEKLRKT